MSQRISSPFGTVMLSDNHQENVLERVFGEGAPDGPARNPRVPAVDVYETDGAFIIMMDLPGVRKPDIDIKYSEGTLSVSAEAKGLERDDGRWIMHERRVGRYVRGISLGRDVDPSTISAEFNDGILEISISKPSVEAAETVDIAIG